MKLYEEFLIKIMEQENPKLPVGKHNDIPDNKFDSKELKKGILIEREHSDDLNICKAIAKDHLSECSIYYSLLEKMERKCEGKNKND